MNKASNQPLNRYAHYINKNIFIRDNGKYETTLLTNVLPE